MTESTYKVNTHCSLVYTLNVWNYLNYIPKKKTDFYLNLLFIKVSCVVNVNKIWVSLETDEGQQNG